jgi:hypothetical protein
MTGFPRRTRSLHRELGMRTALPMNRELQSPFLQICAYDNLQRNYPRNLTEVEARFANAPACPGLPVPTALARGFSLTPSSEE